MKPSNRTDKPIHVFFLAFSLLQLMAILYVLITGVQVQTDILQNSFNKTMVATFVYTFGLVGVVYVTLLFAIMLTAVQSLHRKQRT